MYIFFYNPYSRILSHIYINLHCLTSCSFPLIGLKQVINGSYSFSAYSIWLAVSLSCLTTLHFSTFFHSSQHLLCLSVSEPNNFLYFFNSPFLCDCQLLCVFFLCIPPPSLSPSILCPMSLFLLFLILVVLSHSLPQSLTCHPGLYMWSVV